MDLGLEGKRALVTGSTTAIGFAAAVVVRSIACGQRAHGGPAGPGMQRALV